MQGLEILDGHLYVSTGGYGSSQLLRYRFADTALEKRGRLPRHIFAEGLTILADTVYQLTWRNGLILTYDKAQLEPLGTLPITGEGWGLTNDKKSLIMSNGSDRLQFISPGTGQVLRSIGVTEGGQGITHLNELEWIDGSIWANIWRTDRIVIIEPDSGQVSASIDLRGLLPRYEYRSGTDVLNGIARDPADGSIWVTGKRWPWLYRIELVPVSPKKTNN